MKPNSYAFLFKAAISLILFSGLSFQTVGQQKSVARLWNEALLEAIRNDLARPTVHARNLFHVSAAMYDAWAVYDETAIPYFLGQTHGGFYVELEDFPMPDDIESSRNKAISYACYRLLSHRFSRSPGWEVVRVEFDHLMDSLGYDASYTDMDYTTGSPAALGNYLAQNIIDFGLQDGSNERQNYINQFYEPVNEPLNLLQPYTPEGFTDPNRWQPLQFEAFVDQSGNEIPGGTPAFIGAEWGSVVPFSLTAADGKTYDRYGTTLRVYNDPGIPCFLEEDGTGTSIDYRWTFELVSLWSSHLDPYDGVTWDISPGALGNIQHYPEDYTEYDQFYDAENGGEQPGIADGYSVNPVTGKPYEPQVVPRGDYARVLAEFWADGPDSETPPGHWFTILNYVNDHPLHEKRFQGEGNIIADLEWDVKAYFMLGGAMHDVAISAWSLKGYYDYVRPISAIRYMAAKGQSTDPGLPGYDPHGISLKAGFIEMVAEGDPLAGESGENVGKIKVMAWRGHDYVSDAETDEAGVGWILAEKWWPYQRPSFVTPPFAGYISGHSTFSGAAATVLTLLTGDEYFPGGMGEFKAKKDEFLVFEKGPSVDVTLQWAKYYDASDQCSLSRIWGGIHPPMDDIKGRILGRKLGEQAFDFAQQYFENTLPLSMHLNETAIGIYPNPARSGQNLTISSNSPVLNVTITSIEGKQMMILPAVNMLERRQPTSVKSTIDIGRLNPGVYLMHIKTESGDGMERIVIRD